MLLYHLIIIFKILFLLYISSINLVIFVVIMGRIYSSKPVHVIALENIIENFPVLFRIYIRWPDLYCLTLYKIGWEIFRSRWYGYTTSIISYFVLVQYILSNKGSLQRSSRTREINNWYLEQSKWAIIYRYRKWY